MNPIKILSSSLRRKAVIIPAHRIKHIITAHSLKTGYNIGVCIAKDMTQMQEPDTVGGGVSITNFFYLKEGHRRKSGSSFHFF